MDDNKENLEFNDFMFTALDHRITSIKDNNGPLIPFTLRQFNNGDKRLDRFVSEHIEEFLEKAKQSIDRDNSDIQMYVIVWDGFITIIYHGLLQDFVKQRVNDGGILRLIGK